MKTKTKQKQRILSPILLVLGLLAFGMAGVLFVLTGQQEMDSVGDFFGIIAITSFYSFYIVIALAAGGAFTLFALIAWGSGR